MCLARFAGLKSLLLGMDTQATERTESLRPSCASVLESPALQKPSEDDPQPSTFYNPKTHALRLYPRNESRRNASLKIHTILNRGN